MTGNDEAPLFDVPFCRIEHDCHSLFDSPWTGGEKEKKSSTLNKTPLVYSPNTGQFNQVKERKKYTNKLAKQLQDIGIAIDIESGLEQPSDSNTDPKEQKDTYLPNCNTATEIQQKGYLPTKIDLDRVAEETLEALSDSMADVDDDLCLSDWDPMKASFEQKSFNTYQEQKYNSNFAEKHTLVRGPDGMKISPTKAGIEDVRLYISNIPMNLSENGLMNLFSEVGDCKDVKKCRPKEGSSTTTYGFVTYPSVREAEKAITKFNGFGFNGSSTLRVRLAHQKGQELGDGFMHEKIFWGDNINNSMNGEIHGDEWKMSEPEETSGGVQKTVEPVQPKIRSIGNDVKIPTIDSKSPLEVQEEAKIEPTSADVSTVQEKRPKLFVQGFVVGTSDVEFKMLFDKAGPTHSCMIAPAKKENQRTTYGFVTYEILKDADAAIEMFHNYEFKGNTLEVAYSTQSAADYGKSVKRDRKPRLYIQGLPAGTCDLDLKRLCDQVGLASDCVVVPPKKTGQKTTFGFVSYKTVEEADKAVETFNDFQYYGRTLSVCFSDESRKEYGRKPDEDQAFYDQLYGASPFGDDNLVGEHIEAEPSEYPHGSPATQLNIIVEPPNTSTASTGESATLPKSPVKQVTQLHSPTKPTTPPKYTVKGEEPTEYASGQENESLNTAKMGFIKTLHSQKMTLSKSAFKQNHRSYGDSNASGKTDHAPVVDGTHTELLPVKIEELSFIESKHVIQSKGYENISRNLLNTHKDKTFLPVIVSNLSKPEIYEEESVMSGINGEVSILPGHGKKPDSPGVAIATKITELASIVSSSSNKHSEIRNSCDADNPERFELRCSRSTMVVNDTVAVSESFMSSLETGNSFTVSMLPQNIHPLEAVTMKMDVTVLSSDIEMLHILHVESPHLIYSVFADESHSMQMQMVSKHFAALNDLESLGLLHLKAGSLCSLVDNKLDWCRGVITSVTETNVSVFFIDFGNTATVSHEKVRPLSKDLKSIPAQIIPVKLMTVKPSRNQEEWSNEAVDFLRGIIHNAAVKVLPRHREGAVVNVRMKLNGEPVDKLFQSSGYAVVFEPVIPPVHAESSDGDGKYKRFVPFAIVSKSIPIQAPPIHESFEVIITSVVSPCLFYAQLYDRKNISHVKQIGVKLRKLYSSKPEIKRELTSGQLCGLKLKDNKWYRGFVMDFLADDNAIVWLIDYGNKEVVHISGLWSLPNEMWQFPAQAMCMQLQYVIPAYNAASYTKGALQNFKFLIQWKRMTVEVIKTHGFIYRVLLYDSYTGCDIAQQMVDCGFADFIYKNDINSTKEKKGVRYSYDMQKLLVDSGTPINPRKGSNKSISMQPNVERIYYRHANHGSNVTQFPGGCNDDLLHENGYYDDQHDIANNYHAEMPFDHQRYSSRGRRGAILFAQKERYDISLRRMENKASLMAARQARMKVGHKNSVNSGKDDSILNANDILCHKNSNRHKQSTPQGKHNWYQNHDLKRNQERETDHPTHPIYGEENNNCIYHYDRYNKVHQHCFYGSENYYDNEQLLHDHFYQSPYHNRNRYKKYLASYRTPGCVGYEDMVDSHSRSRYQDHGQKSNWL